MKVSSLRNIMWGVASLLMFSSLSYAVADREVRIAELESQMKQVGTMTPEGVFGANTASARPNVEGEGWFLTFDVLYWRTKIGGTEYAYTDADPIGKLPVNGKKKHMEFNWDWGLRAGLGYNFDYDGWDFRAQYTWWNSAGSDTTHAGQSNSITPLRGSATVTESPQAQTKGQFAFCTSAKSLFDLDYQTIDLELGRDYYMTDKVSFRPFWGVKTAWIDLEQKTQYTGGAPINVGQGSLLLGLSGNTVHVKEKSDFWGVGPRTGLNSRWYIGEGFSFFSNLSGAFIWGYFDVEHKEKYSAAQDGRMHLHANRHAFSPTMQLQMGLRYETYLNHDQQHLSLGIGFEGQYWWRQNQALKVDDRATLKYTRYSDDLAFYGITAEIKWDF